MDRRGFLRSIFGLSATIPAMASLPTGPSPRAILIQTLPVAGFQYYQGETVWAQLAPGDSLELRREAGNKHDKFAIEVYRQGRKLGYLPRGDNETIAAMMDWGEKFSGRISRRQTSRNPWTRLEIEVWLTT